MHDKIVRNTDRYRANIENIRLWAVWFTQSFSRDFLDHDLAAEIYVGEFEKKFILFIFIV